MASFNRSKTLVVFTLLLITSLFISGCLHDKAAQNIKQQAKEQIKETKEKPKPTTNGISKKQLKKQKEALTDKDTDGKKFGYIKAVYLFNHVPYLEINYAQMLTGTQAKIAADKAGEGPLDTDYYISDENPKLRTFEIADNIPITMATWKANEEASMSAKKLTFNEFMNIFNGDDPEDKRMAASPYWLVLKKNKIVKIDEQYLP